MCNRRKKDQFLEDTEEIKEDINTLAEDVNSQVSKGYENIKEDAQTSFQGALQSVKKDFEHGLDQYNKKAQELADKILGGLSKEVTNYPWISISVALVIGTMIGGFLKPGRRS